jgi:transcriptional regulator with XRE-family HTH domain
MPQVPKHELKPLDLGNQTIGQRIAGLRKERGLSQLDLAERIGISRQLVASYERGRVRLYDEMVARFAIALGVSADEILGLNQAESKEMKTHPSLRLTRRLRELENLPEQKKKKILNTLDDLIRANS